MRKEISGGHLGTGTRTADTSFCEIGLRQTARGKVGKGKGRINTRGDSRGKGAQEHLVRETTKGLSPANGAEDKRNPRKEPHEKEVIGQIDLGGLRPLDRANVAEGRGKLKVGVKCRKAGRC